MKKPMWHRLYETGGDNRPLADIQVAFRLHGSQKIKGLTLIYDHGFQIIEKKNQTKSL
jgi:hypothetical protein